MLKNCQKIAKKLPKKCQKNAKKMPKNAKKLPKNCQKIAKKLPKTCQKIAKNPLYEGELPYVVEHPLIIGPKAEDCYYFGHNILMDSILVFRLLFFPEFILCDGVRA